MVVSEGEALLLAWFTEEAFDVFEPASADLECFLAGGVDGRRRVLFNQMAKSHDGSQCLGSSSIHAGLRPLAAGFAEQRRAPDPPSAEESTGALIPAAPRMRLNFPGSRRRWICTCSRRSLKMRTQRLSQRTHTCRPIYSGGAS